MKFALEGALTICLAAMFSLPAHEAFADDDKTADAVPTSHLSAAVTQTSVVEDTVCRAAREATKEPGKCWRIRRPRSVSRTSPPPLS